LEGGKLVGGGWLPVGNAEAVSVGEADEDDLGLLCPGDGGEFNGGGGDGLGGHLRVAFDGEKAEGAEVDENRDAVVGAADTDQAGEGRYHLVELIGDVQEPLWLLEDP
jgi:hypothetical protein